MRGTGAGKGLVAVLLVPVGAVRRTAGEPRMRRVQVAYAGMTVALWTATVSLTVVAWTEGGSAAVAAAVVARAAPGLVAGPLLGRLVDRVDRHRCLLWAAVLSCVACVGAAVAGESLVAVVALSALVALCAILFRTALGVVVTELVDEPEDLTSANVLATTTEALGVFVGPALAGLLLAVQGPPLAFSAAAVVYATSALLVTGVRGTAEVPGAVAAPEAGLGAVLRLPTARLLLALTLVQTVVSGGLVALYPALAVDGVGVDVSAVGLLTAAYGLGGIVAAAGLFALAGSSRLGLALAAATLLWSVPLLLLPLVTGLTGVLAVLVVVGVGNALFDVTLVTLCQRGLPAPLLGRALGAVETAVVAGVGLGAAVAPLLDERLGPRAAVAVLASPLLVAGLLVLRPLRRLDRDLAAPSRQVALLRGTHVFRALPTLATERLALRLVPLHVEPDRPVVRQGDPGATWYVVDSGLLAVTVDGQVVHELGAGDSFGEIALVRDGARTATVTALTGTDLWSLSGPEFLGAVRTGGGHALAGVDLVAATHLGRAAPARRD